MPAVILQQLIVLTTVTSLGFLPFASAESAALDPRRLAEVFRANLRMTVLAIGPVVAFLAIWGHPLLTTWIDRGFADDAIGPLRYLAGAAALVAIGAPPADVARGLNRPAWVVAYTGAAAVIAVAVGFALVGPYGATGVAAALCGALLVATVPFGLFVADRLLALRARDLVGALALPVLAVLARGGRLRRRPAADGELRRRDRRGRGRHGPLRRDHRAVRSRRARAPGARRPRAGAPAPRPPGRAGRPAGERGLAMCGIAGVLHPDGRPVDRDVLQRMGDSIAHRGPDGEGFHVDDGRPSAGLVSRRLAVIDIEGGAQPMSIEDGAFTIVYNGEIFNAAELRRELESAGHRFRTRCDTEVVLRGYATWGEDVVQRLNGMWAFAIWERAARRLFVARDRLGVKPLVYAETPDGLVFASEIKALLASGLVERRLDPAALPHYLSAFAVPEPYSLVAGVRRLRAGHVLTVDGGGVHEREYWDCAPDGEADRGFSAYVEEVESLLEDAVRRRMVSDVPIGVLLSGGVDSRTIAAFASRAVGERLRTFTLGFDVPGADERGAARAAANALGAEHYEQLLDARGAAAQLPDLIAAYDEPGESLVQNHVISQFARRHVTVGISGVGGDELFASYPTHVVVNMLGRFDTLPDPLRAGVTAASGRAPVRQLRRFAELAAMSPTTASHGSCCTRRRPRCAAACCRTTCGRPPTSTARRSTSPGTMRAPARATLSTRCSTSTSRPTSPTSCCARWTR